MLGAPNLQAERFLENCETDGAFGAEDGLGRLGDCICCGRRRFWLNFFRGRFNLTRHNRRCRLGAACRFRYAMLLRRLGRWWRTHNFSCNRRSRRWWLNFCKQGNRLLLTATKQGDIGSEQRGGVNGQ
jgi:hypothetical protein